MLFTHCWCGGLAVDVREKEVTSNNEGERTAAIQMDYVSLGLLGFVAALLVGVENHESMLLLVLLLWRC